jgi:hypothetical protein
MKFSEAVREARKRKRIGATPASSASIADYTFTVSDRPGKQRR